MVSGRDRRVPGAWAHAGDPQTRSAARAADRQRLGHDRRLYPVDVHANASGQRRALEPITPMPPAPAPPSGEMAPLLQQLLADYAATGLPAAYLPAAGEKEEG